VKGAAELGMIGQRDHKEAIGEENGAVVITPAEDSTVRRLWGLWAAVVALGFVAYLFHGYDADELQHLHILWRIGQGELPYRDFFEHHPPLFHLLLAPLFRSFSEADVTVLLLARTITLSITLLSLRLLTLLLRRFVSPVSACVGIGAMIALPVFGRSAMELRPDVAGLLSILGAVLVLARSLRPGRMTGARSTLFAGALFGTAACFTQKALVALAGAAIWMGVACLFAPPKRGERIRRFVALLALMTGAGLTVGACALLFAAMGAGREFWEYVFAINLRWKRIAPGWHCMPETLLLCFPLFVFALTALARMLEGGGALLRDVAPETLIGALLLAGIAGQLATPIPTWQSVLVFLAPWTACLSAIQIARFASEPGSVHADRLRLLAASALVLSAMTWLNTAIGAAIWSVMTWIVWRVWRHAGSVEARLRCLMAMSLLPGLVYRIGFAADQVYQHKYAEQQRIMRYLQAHTAPTEAVLHPWPVLLPFRMAATRHWCAPLDMLNTLAGPPMEAEYIAALQSGRVRLAAVHPRRVERFLPGFHAYLQTRCRRLKDAPATGKDLQVYACPAATRTSVESSGQTLNAP
jgi:hypothetical protein